MTHKKQRAIALIREGVQLLLDYVADLERANKDYFRIIHSLEMTEAQNQEKIQKLRQTIRAQQATLQNEQHKGQS